MDGSPLKEKRQKGLSKTFSDAISHQSKCVKAPNNVTCCSAKNSFMLHSAQEALAARPKPRAPFSLTGVPEQGHPVHSSSHTELDKLLFPAAEPVCCGDCNHFAE